MGRSELLKMWAQSRHEDGTLHSMRLTLRLLPQDPTAVLFLKVLCRKIVFPVLAAVAIVYALYAAVMILSR